MNLFNLEGRLDAVVKERLEKEREAARELDEQHQKGVEIEFKISGDILYAKAPQ